LRRTVVGYRRWNTADQWIGSSEKYQILCAGGRICRFFVLHMTIAGIAAENHL